MVFNILADLTSNNFGFLLIAAVEIGSMGLNDVTNGISML